jgi:peptide methionine sulfoxide reductase msrA/msrB
MKAIAGFGLLAVLLAGIGYSLAAPPLAKKPLSSKSPNAKKEPAMVAVYVFNKEGKLVGPVDSPRVELTDAEWRKRLTPEQFKILRSKGTERPFCGALLDNKKQGVYTCVGCGLPLFSSDSKFHSGTGWPSFFATVGKGNVAEEVDRSHGMIRTEINCGRCDGHLGHVFDDGPPPTGLRYCLNSESLAFTELNDFAKLADPAAENFKAEASEDDQRPSIKQTSNATKTATAVLAGGCFWCTEAAYEQLEGVLDVESGYSGGEAKTANYKMVSTGRTGHAEAIRVTYDPEKISYEQLLDVFFDAHDPTTLNRQGADKGTQYRSAIFYTSDEEKQIAEAKIAEIDKRKVYPNKIVTTLEALEAFYPAEDYHQDYARLNPLQPYIQGVSMPKVCKVREKHAKLLKPGVEGAEK